MKTNLFLELIRVAIGRQESLTRCPSAVEWEEMYDIAYRQTLVAICFSAIERLPLEQQPPIELLMQWYAITEQTEMQNQLMNEYCQQTLTFFRKAGFHPTILKGQGMARLYNINENANQSESQSLLEAFGTSEQTRAIKLGMRRQSGDIDVWLDGGRKRVFQFAKQHNADGQLHGKNYHHVHFHLFNDVEVEAHIYPGYLYNPFANKRLQRFFKKHYPKSMEDYPNWEFNVIFILQHCFNHLLGHGVGLRQVMDYYFVLMNGKNHESHKLHEDKIRKPSPNLNLNSGYMYEMVRELGMLRFAKGMMWVMQEVFDLNREYLIVEPDEKEGRFILNEILETGNMGHHDKRNWGSLRTPLSRFFYNLRRDWHFLGHYPQTVLWQPLFSLWLFIHQKFVWR